MFVYLFARNRKTPSASIFLFGDGGINEGRKEGWLIEGEREGDKEGMSRYENQTLRKKKKR